MPIVPYYLGRPAHVWIAAMSSRGSDRKDKHSGVVRGSTPPGRSTLPEAGHAGPAHPGAGATSTS
jgi:hypothetical protein